MNTKRELTYLYWSLGRDLLLDAVSPHFHQSTIPLQWLDVGEQLDRFDDAIPYQVSSVDIENFIANGSTVAEFSTRLLKLLLLIGKECPVLQSHYVPGKEFCFVSKPPDKLYSVTPSFKRDCWVVRCYSFKNPRLCEEASYPEIIPSKGFFHDTSSGLGVFSYLFSKLGVPRPFWDKSEPLVPLFPDDGRTLGIHPPPDIVDVAKELRSLGLHAQVKMDSDNPKTGSKAIEFLDYGIRDLKIVKSGVSGLFHLEREQDLYYPPEDYEQWNAKGCYIPQEVIYRLLSAAGATKSILTELNTRVSQLDYLFNDIKK